MRRRTRQFDIIILGAIVVLVIIINYMNARRAPVIVTTPTTQAHQVIIEPGVEVTVQVLQGSVEVPVIIMTVTP